MKVRHKATGIEFEVIGWSHVHEDEYYAIPGGSLIHKKDPLWSLVPEVEYEDVTHACYVCETGFVPNAPATCITHNGNHLAVKSGYRIRMINGMYNGPAFIVERRKEQ